jgi:hypothetical protein
MFWKKKSEPEPSSEPPPESKDIWLYRTDSLQTRAEKILSAMGFRGAIHHHALCIMQVLEIYDGLDRQAREAGDHRPLSATCPLEEKEEAKDEAA